MQAIVVPCINSRGLPRVLLLPANWAEDLMVCQGALALAAKPISTSPVNDQASSSSHRGKFAPVLVVGNQFSLLLLLETLT